MFVSSAQGNCEKLLRSLKQLLSYNGIHNLEQNITAVCYPTVIYIFASL